MIRAEDESVEAVVENVAVSVVGNSVPAIAGFYPPLTVRPLCIWAANEREFECCSPADWTSSMVVNDLFDRFDFGRYGWHAAKMRVLLLGERQAARFWKISKLGD